MKLKSATGQLDPTCGSMPNYYIIHYIFKLCVFGNIYSLSKLFEQSDFLKLQPFFLLAYTICSFLKITNGYDNLDSLG